MAHQKTEHDKIYDDEYFDFVEQTTTRSVDAIARSIMQSLHPATLVDVGCGTGVLMANLREQGVRVKGLEYAEAALKLCRSRHLEVIRFDARVDDLPSEFANADVAVSMEMGHQLPESSADRYVDLLCRIAPVVIFSSGTPEQRDSKPLNGQPHEYWIEKFAQRGYGFDEALSRQWREEWKEKGTSKWFYRNVMVFHKRAAD